ncbi:hypothetical protein ABZP36_024282 [Zizania latifolia]
MRTEMVIKMQASSEKGHAKAMKVAAAIQGVESVTLAGEGRNLLRVVGNGVDSNHLTSRLRRKVGHADIVELRTLHDHRPHTTTTSGRLGAGGSGYYYSSQLSGGRGDIATYERNSSYSPAASYYQQQQHLYDYYQPPYAATIVHHEYPSSSNDPNGCSIM